MRDISNHYREQGVDAFYLENKDSYVNPHALDVEICLGKIWDGPVWRTARVLDMACGDGLVSKWIARNHKLCAVEGADKFMAERYVQETGNACHGVSFEEVAKHNHSLATYDLVIISYGYDLIPKSYRNSFLWEMYRITNNLLIIRPNNKFILTPLFELASATHSNKAKAKLYSKRENYGNQRL